MKLLDGVVWCDLHGGEHDKCTNPFGGCPTEYDELGRPVWLHYVAVDKDGNVTEDRNVEYHEELRPMPPECGPENWRKLWIGGPV